LALSFRVWATASPEMPEPTMATFMAAAPDRKCQGKLPRSAPKRTRGRRRKTASGLCPG
jgi:hypothetical protein